MKCTTPFVRQYESYLMWARVLKNVKDSELKKLVDMGSTSMLMWMKWVSVMWDKFIICSKSEM